MDRDRLLSDLDGLVDELEGAHERVKNDIAEGLRLGDRLRDAARKLGDASSNSWVGWHSRMYYRDYQEPPVNESWNTEWGGLYGYPEGWQERNLREVQAEAESRAGLQLADVARIADRVRETCQPLQREVLTVVSPICDLGALDKEAALLNKIETIDWIVSPSNFIEAIRPTQIWSRDSGALSQGMQVPLHLNVEAAIVSNTATLAACRTFLDDSIRLARQVRTKLAATRSTAELVRGDASETERLRKRLRNLGVVRFLCLAVGASAALVFVLRRWDMPTLAQAGVIVGGAALVAGLYALLIDRRHAVRALVVAGGAAGAIAAVDQALTHFQ